MKQVIRRGIGEIIVDQVPAPAVSPHHVLVRPLRSLISSGTGTASLHTGSLLNSERVEGFVVGVAAGAEDFRRSIEIGTGKPSTRRRLAAKGHVEQMQAFGAAARGERAPEVTLIDGIRATIGCLRMLESAADGGAPKAIDLAGFR